MLRRLAFAMAAFVALLGNAFAQATTGSITGRVLNATNGRYVNNAHVTIEGSNVDALTDASGQFRLDGVPAGLAKIHVFYTGLPETVETVTVTGGATSTIDVNLGGATAQNAGEVLKLDAFTVASHRETDAASLAINEQRFAPTIKQVVNTDAFGDIAEANIGDFVKFLPGVTIDYVSPDARTVSVRGVPAQYTAILLNGFNVASASSSSTSRTVELEQISLKNASRIEVTKSRSPSMMAQALGGAINLVPRSAFEATKPSVNYRLSLSANGDEKQLGKTRGPGDSPSHKVKPGFDFTFEDPITKNFGITLSLMESDIFYPQHRTQPLYGPYNGSQNGATPEHPVLRQYQVQDGPKNNQRESVGFTAGWRFTPVDVLTFDFQWSYYNAFFGNRPVTYTLGNTAPTATNGAVFDPNGTRFWGASGTGTVSLGGTSFRRKYGATWQPDLVWTHNGPVWKADLGAAFSHGSNHYHDYQDSHFENVTAQLRGNPTTTAVGNATVHFDDIDKGSYLYPTVRVFDNTGTKAIDLSDPANYNLTSAGFNPADSVDQFRQVRSSAGRDLDLKFPFLLKTGIMYSEEIRDIRKDNPGSYTFVGPDGKANTADDSLALYDVLDTQYSTQPFLFSTPQVPYPSPYKVYQLYQQHPGYFQAPTAATAIQNVSTASMFLKERISAAFIEADVRPFHALRIVGGIRFERTDDTAQGPTNDPNAAKGITDPTAAARARYGIRTNHVKKHYAAGYPSIDISYNIRPHLIGRFAYYKAIGRPELGYIIPSTSVPDTTTGTGTITVSNSALKPTQNDSYDVSLEYYFANSGVFSVAAFEKDFANFPGSASVPATLDLLTQLGVPNPELYTGAQGTYTVSTRFNAGTAKVTGGEFNFSQVLKYDWLPTWANDKFRVFVNGFRMHLEGETTADFSNFIREGANWGISYAPRKFTILMNFNYRGRQRLGQQTFTWTDASGPHTTVGYEYWKPRVYLDTNFEYRIKPYVSLFINARNLTNVAQDIQRYAPVVTPSWARTYRREEFGVQYTVGLKGKF
jgi:TonB-dependent receptor